MIPTLLSRSNTKEVLTCVDNCLIEVENTTITENPHFEAMRNKLLENKNVLDAAYGLIRKHELSEALEEDDDGRDNQVRGIFYCLRGFTFSEDLIISKNATILLDLLNAQGTNIVKQGYAEETAILNSFLLKIYAAEYLSIMQSLPGMKSFFDSLKARNERFQNTYQENLRNLAAADPGIPASKQRKLTRDVLNNVFIPYVNVMSTALPGEFGELAKVIAEAVERINTNVRTRLSRKKAEQETVQE